MAEIEELEDKPILSPEVISRFLVERPLYVREAVRVPSNRSFLDATRVFDYCPECKIERPFRDLRPRGGGTGLTEPKLTSGCYYYSFHCAGCRFHLEYWLELNVEESWIRKVGQRPPWSIRTSSDLERLLGDDLGLFQKGKICLGQGYGLGACAYFRRVIENQVNRILELLIEVATQDPTKSGSVAELRKLLDSKAADKKLSTAAKHVPPSLIVDGVNPVKLIYDRLSRGIHGLSDDQCSQVAQELAASLEYVLLETTRHLAQRRNFAAEIREVAKGAR